VSLNAREVASRLTRLADNLATLKSRVREAVAGETVRAVGDAIRDLLAAALTGRTTVPRPVYRASEPGWNDDRDRWREEEDDQYFPASSSYRSSGEERRTTPESSPEPSARWSAALVFGAAAVRCWASRRVPAWAAVGVGLLAGAAAWAGGAVSRAGLALLAAAADLLPLAELSMPWGIDSV